MAKTVKFYFADGIMSELTNSEDKFELFVGIKNTIKYGDVYLGYTEYPSTSLKLKTFYEENLTNKDVMKVEFYSDEYLLDTISKEENKIVQVRWQTGKLRNGEEVVQEEINISECYI